MKVKELIERLKELPQDADVFIMESNDLGDFISEISEPYFGSEPYSERFVGGELVYDYKEGVIII